MSLAFLSALLGVSFFVGNGLLFAQSSPFECTPAEGSKSGGFTDVLTIPEGITNTEALNQDKIFTINCVNTTDLSKKATDDATAQIIYVDLTAGVPTLAGAGTGVANQFYAGTIAISGKATNIGNTSVAGTLTNLYQYRRTGNTTWNDLTIPLPLYPAVATLGAQGSGKGD